MLKLRLGFGLLLVACTFYGAYAACPNLNLSFTVPTQVGCGVPQNFSFDNTSTGTNANNVAYIWKIDGVRVDSTFGTVPNFNYTFGGPGTFVVRVVAITPGNCRDSIQQSVTITSGAPLVYDGNLALTFTPRWTNCIINPLQSNNYNMSVSSNVVLNNYTIIWGDATANATGASLLVGNVINHTYTTLGLFTIKIVTVNAGCSDTITGTVVNMRPVSTSIKPLPAGQLAGCAPHTITFQDTTQNALPGTILTWNFGDGTVITRDWTQANQPITHTYLPTGNGNCIYTVSLSAINTNCNTGTNNASVFTISPILIFDKDVAQINPPSNLCQPTLTYTFGNSSQDNCITGQRYYYWSFGDGTNTGWITTKNAQTHTFPSLGPYTIMLIDSNACGSDTTYTTVTINAPPVVGFTMSPKFGCAPLTVTLTDTSLGTGNTRFWTLLGTTPNSSTLPTLTRTYNNPGTYVIRLSVSNACANNIIVRDTLRVFAKPNVSIGNATSGCVPHTIQVQNNTTNQGPNATYLWDFGNGQTSTLRNPPPITYTTTGSFPIKLIVTDTCGKDSQTVTIAVSTLPNAQFTATNVCRGTATTFTSSSTVAPGDVITGYKWIYGNGDSTNAGTAVQNFTYPASGTFNAILQITTDKTCVDRDTVVVSVRASPTISFVSTPSNICDGTVVNFNGTASTVAPSTIASYRWTFGTADTARVEDTVYRFPGPATYNVVYSVSNNAGCTTNMNSSITVHPVPDARLFKTLACRGQRTFFTDSSVVGFGNTINQWAWDFDNNGVTDSTTQNPSFVFPSTGTFKTKLTVTTNNGCSNTDSINTIVNSTPTAAVASNAPALCKGDTFNFINNSLGAFAYSWTFGDGSGDFFVTSTAPFPYIYSDTGQFTTKLVAFSLQGCKDSATVPVISRPLPVASFSVNDTIGCAPKTFTFSNSSILSNGYKWLVGNTQTSTATNRPDTLIALSGQIVPIRLVATNQFNCKPDTAVKTLYTFGNPTPNFTISKDSGCGPLSVSFINTTPNGSSYRWRLGNGDTANTLDAGSIYLPSQQNDSTYQVKLIANNIAGCRDSITKTVRVFPRPVSAFSHAINNGCGPLAVTFTNNSNHKFGGNISNMTFNWDFGNNTSSTQQNPTGTFFASATKDTIYPVRLISFSRYGCADTSSSSVRVFPKAKAAFTINAPAGCGPHTTTFTNNSIPNDTGSIGIMTFAWRFANGQTSTLVNPQATYVASKTIDSIYSPRLIAFSEHGCADTTFGVVRVYPNPKSVFTPSVSSGCGPLNVTFTNQSFPNDTGTINNMTFLWNYGNGFSDVTKDGASQFTARLLADTPYTIRLTAFSEHGCIDTTTRKITVRPNPVTAFSTNKTAGCGPLNVQFTNNTQLGFKYYWDFGDGDTTAALSPAHTYTSYQIFDSIYEVKLASQSIYGCLGDTVKTTIIARYDPIADFFPSSDSLCGGGNIAFFNSSLGGTVNNWSFGNGQSSVAINPVANFAGLPTRDTTYTVRLISTSPYGCKDTIFKPIKINALPDAQFTSVAPACHPYPVTFNNTSLRAVKYEWDFGDATFDTVNSNASKIFTNTLTLVNRVYPVTLTAKSASGCIDTAKRNITVYPLPVSSFSPNQPSGCGPLTTSFVNSSIPNDSNIATFAWRFGNGLQSTLKSPTTTYTPSALVDSLFTSRLIVSSQFGCKDTSYQTLRVFPKPKAIFTPDITSGCGPLNVTFNNTSIPNDTGTIKDMSFVWQYGNGFGATTQNGSSQFLARNLADTTYTVKLIAYSEHGCLDTATAQVTVRPKPATAFIPDKFSGCSPLVVSFTNTSQLGSTYHWNFGTNDTANTINPIRTFSTNQLFDSSYLVKLVAKSIFGCVGDTFTRTITARYIPIANFSPAQDSICGSGNVPFNNTSIGGAQNNWNFGNGAISSGINPVSNFTALLTRDTTYQTKLVVTTTNGCKDSITKPIKVNPLPEALFANVVPGCTPYQVTFNNTSLRGVKYEWDFGDATFDTVNNNASKVFTNTLTLANRIYPVTLTAKSASGCIDTAKRNITVYPLPNVSITALKTLRCDTSEYNFLNATQGASSYLWRFGDGNTSTLQSPTHYYRTLASANIPYTAKMIATSTNGCKDSAEVTVTVRPLVVADFIASATSKCLNLDVQFQNQSRNAVNYFWLFGDGGGTNANTPKYKYSNTGSFDVTLIAYDQFGCSDTTVKPAYINIYEIPKALFSYNPIDPQLPNTLVNFTNLSTISSGTLTSEWNFGDALSPNNTSTLENPSHNYSDSGNFNPTLIVTSNQGCKDTADRILRVDPRKPIPAFDCDPKSGCKPLTVTFTNQSLYAYTYRWDFGDGTKSTEANPVHTYSRADSFTVELTAYGPGGDSTLEKRNLIVVHDLPRARFTANPTNIFLPEAYSSFTNTSFDAVKSFWTVTNDSNNIVFEDTSYNSGFDFTDDGFYSIRLVVQNQFGCADTSVGVNIINVDKSGTIFIPNAFSPNGDNTNEVFLPVVTGVRRQGYEFRVYDRWGRLVFETNDPSKGWDGMIYGSPGVTDVYVWLIEGTFVTNNRFIKKGSVSLLR